MPPRRPGLALIPTLMLAAAAGTLAAQATPVTGRALLQRMHDRYAGRWFSSLTFVQTTTIRDSTGHDHQSTWYEALRYTDRHHTELRIDTGDPSAGNGVLYSGDSLHIFRAGKQVAVREGGNALLPLIAGVYLQPVARTVAELGATGVDFDRLVVPASYDGRPMLIVGAAGPGDSTSPQFWVDRETNVVRRAIFPPVPGAPRMDMRLDGIVKAGGGWLATRCEFYVDGRLLQREEYHDPTVGATLSPGLFDPATWSNAPHWKKGG